VGVGHTILLVNYTYPDYCSARNDSGWWFGTFFGFPNIGNNNPNCQLTNIFSEG
jgi:hypothetical protein